MEKSMSWQLHLLSDHNLGKLQNALEDTFLTQESYPTWIDQMHFELLAELDRREALDQSRKPTQDL